MIHEANVCIEVDRSALRYLTAIKFRILIMGEAFIVAAQFAKTANAKGCGTAMINETALTTTAMRGTAGSHRSVGYPGNGFLKARFADAIEGHDDGIGPNLVDAFGEPTDESGRIGCVRVATDQNVSILAKQLDGQVDSASLAPLRVVYEPEIGADHGQLSNHIPGCVRAPAICHDKVYGPVRRQIDGQLPQHRLDRRGFIQCRGDDQNLGSDDRLGHHLILSPIEKPSKYELKATASNDDGAQDRAEGRHSRAPGDFHRCS